MHGQWWSCHLDHIWWWVVGIYQEGGGQKGNQFYGALIPMFLAHDHHDEKDPYLVAPQYRMISLQIVWLNDTVISVHRSHEPPLQWILKNQRFLLSQKKVFLHDELWNYSLRQFFPEEKNKLGTFLNSLGWMQCTSEKRLLGHVCLLVGNYFSDELKWVIPRYSREKKLCLLLPH